MNQLERSLGKIRRYAIKADAVALLWFIYSGLIGLFLFSVLLESIFYFSTSIRYGLWELGLKLSLLALAGIIVFFVLIFLNRIRRYHWSTIAREVGRAAYPKEDAVLNALQLERNLDSSRSPRLSRVYIHEIFLKLNAINPQTLFPRDIIQKIKLLTIIILFLTLATLTVSMDQSSAAIYRWTHPRTKFLVPQPFQLFSLSGDVHILGGESTEIVVHSIYDHPDTVYLRITQTAGIIDDPDDGRESRLSAVMDESGYYVFKLEEVYRDYIYQAFVPADHFWQAWKEISSESHQIKVTDRPAMESFTIMVIPPEYTHLKVETQMGNQANVQGLKGSTIGIRFKSNRPLDRSYLKLNDNELPLITNGKNVEGEFKLEEEGTFTVHLVDQRGITNAKPIPYHLQILPDEYPRISVISPDQIIELGDNQLIPIHLNIEDDFGFKDLQIAYEIHRPAFISTDTLTSMFSIREFVPDETRQDILTIWDVSELNLMPEDEIHYHFEVVDNDVIEGPKTTRTGNFIARLPSLEDIYDEIQKEENSIMEESIITAEQLEELQENIENIEMDLLKSEDLNWDQQKEIKALVEAIKSKMEQFQKMSEALSNLNEYNEKHSLFSEKLQEKFSSLQKLIQELISEDLLQNMESLETALEEMNLEDVMSAMEDMSKNMDQIERELDRFIDIFKRIKAEQKMEELSQRLKQMKQQQDALDQDIATTDLQTEPDEFKRLEDEENRIKDEFDHIMDEMKEASDLTREFSEETADKLMELTQSELAENTDYDLNEAIDWLESQQPLMADQASTSALENIQSLESMMQEIAEQFQQQTSSEMAQKFQKIMKDIITLSKAQESLENSTRATPRNSPRSGDLASHQQMLLDQLNQIMAALMELSKETFSVTPEMGRPIGKTYGAMENAKSQLESRNNRQALKQQQLAMSGLNETAQAVFNSMQQMQSGGSASGFEEFLKRMESMSGQQQGLNQSGLPLAMGQMGRNARQSLMQQLLKGQKQIRKSLEQLMQEMQGSGNQSGGDLSGMAQDMDEVIKDLQRNRYTRKTKERQQRILSRMLDSQKSMTTRGEKEDRKSKTAINQYTYKGPAGLPDDLGQRHSLIMEALDRSMKAGYSRDYQTMIRRYFNIMNQQEFENTETKVQAE